MTAECDVKAGGPKSLRVVAHALGPAVAVAGISWVLWLAFSLGEGLLEKLHEPKLLSLLVGLSLLYGVLSLVIAVAWWWLTGIQGVRPRLQPCLGVWARTLVGKYLPGNVAHYVGRQVMGRLIGLEHGALIAIHVLELTALTTTAALIVLPVLVGRHWQAEISLFAPLLLAILALGVIVFALTGVVIRRLSAGGRHLSQASRLHTLETIRLFIPVVILDAIFLLGSGLLFAVLLVLGWPAAGRAALDLIWVYPLAWAVGTVTPGAPGGLGVREAVLTASLRGVLSSGEAASFALMVRIVTILGDLVVVGIGWLIRLEKKES